MIAIEDGYDGNDDNDNFKIDCSVIVVSACEDRNEQNEFPLFRIDCLINGLESIGKKVSFRCGNCLLFDHNPILRHSIRFILSHPIFLLFFSRKLHYEKYSRARK